MNVVRVRNPAAFRYPVILDLFERAFADHPLTQASVVIEELRDMIDDENVGVFIGAEKGELKALAIVFMPLNKLFHLPQVYYVWSKGSAALRNKLVSTFLDYVRSAGYNRVWAVNMAADDVTHTRLFRKHGRGTRVGSILEYDIGPQNERTVRGRKEQVQVEQQAG